VRGSSAPARAYIPELLPDVLDGRINPSRVLDYVTDLDRIADAYAAMDERRHQVTRPWRNRAVQ
jgi:alcohol dehydrogenase